MTSKELKIRLQSFAVRILKMSEKLPNTSGSNAVRNQIVRSGTSPGANYRAACIAKSEKDFLNKLKMVEEELDETIYWIEIIILMKYLEEKQVKNLLSEANELIAIMVQSIKTGKQKINSK